MHEEPRLQKQNCLLRKVESPYGIYEVMYVAVSFRGDLFYHL